MKKHKILILLLLIIMVTSMKITNVKAVSYGLMYKPPVEVSDAEDPISWGGIIIDKMGVGSPTYYWTPLNQAALNFDPNSTDWHDNEYNIDIDENGKVYLKAYSAYYPGTFLYVLNKLFGVREVDCYDESTCKNYHIYEDLDTKYASYSGYEKSYKHNPDLTKVQEFYDENGKLPEVMLVCFELINDPKFEFYPASEMQNSGYDEYINVISKNFTRAQFPEHGGYQYQRFCNYVSQNSNTLLACSMVEEKLATLKHIATTNGCNNDKFKTKFSDLIAFCDTYKKNNDANECSTLCDNVEQKILNMCPDDFSISELRCGSLGPELIGWLMKILKIIRYIVPVLVIVLSVIDYIQAIGSSNDEALKKASGKFVKRLIAAAIIFLLPVILQFLFDVFKIKGLDSSNPFCMK